MKKTILIFDNSGKLKFIGGTCKAKDLKGGEDADRN